MRETARRSVKRTGGAPAQRADYLVLGRPVTIETDSRPLLSAFDADYSRFRSRRAHADTALRISVLTAPRTGAPRLEVRGGAAPGESPCASRPLTTHGDPVRSGYRALLRQLFSSLDGFLVLHAGVVATGGCAVVIAGPPGAGKTTLVLELVDAGLTFFSDDFCPLDRASGLVHPFPRSPWVVGGGSGEEPGARPRKRPLRAPAGPSSAAARPCPPGLVIVLDPGDRRQARRVVELGVAPDAIAAVARDLGALGDGVLVERGPTALPALRVSFPPGAGRSAKVREVLERHAGDIPELFRDDAVRPRFDRAPRLAPLARHEAALALLADVKHAPWERGDTPGAADSPAALLMELAGLLGNADCRRLAVGRLEEMRDIILSLLGGRAPREGVS